MKSAAKSTDKLYFGHVRTEEQRKLMEEIAARDICFMCPEHIEEFYAQKNGLVKEGKYVYLVKNTFPYENTAHHLLIIPKKHMESLNELTEAIWAETLTILKEQERKLELKGAAIAMRFGDPAMTGASVHHLHMHLIVPRGDIKPEDKPVKFRMSHKASQD